VWYKNQLQDWPVACSGIHIHWQLCKLIICIVFSHKINKRTYVHNIINSSCSHLLTSCLPIKPDHIPCSVMLQFYVPTEFMHLPRAIRCFIILTVFIFFKHVTTKRWFKAVLLLRSTSHSWSKLVLW